MGCQRLVGQRLLASFAEPDVGRLGVGTGAHPPAGYKVDVTGAAGIAGEPHDTGVGHIEAFVDIGRTMEAAFAAGFDMEQHVVGRVLVGPAWVEVGGTWCQRPKLCVDQRDA